MTGMDCEHCRRVAAELALGVLCGREHAAAVAHLQRCDRCQDAVVELTATVHRFLELVPEEQPPDGFGDRVLAAITPPPEPPPPDRSRTAEPAAPARPPPPSVPARHVERSRAARRPTRVPVTAALLAGAALLTCGGWALADHDRPVPGAGDEAGGQPVSTVMEAPLMSRDRPRGSGHTRKNHDGGSHEH